MHTLQPIENQVNFLDEDDLEDVLAKFNDKEISVPETVEDASAWMEYFYVYHMMGGEFKRENEILETLRTGLDVLMENSETKENATDLFVEWGLLVIARIPEMKDSFASFPIYEELLERLGDVPDALKYKISLLRVHLIQHLVYWERLAGITHNDLPEEEAKFINDNIKIFPSEAEEFITLYEKAGDIEGKTTVKHALFRYYSFMNKIDKVIEIGEELKDDWKLRSDYSYADIAELEMDMGRVLLGAQKFQEALTHFEEARKIFDELGEEWELFKFKAEGQIEICEYRLK